MCVCMYLTINKMVRLVSASVLSSETVCDLLHMLTGIVTYIR